MSDRAIPSGGPPLLIMQEPALSSNVELVD
jgi:hypothetical protein